jgi:hypothetical protein
MGALSAIVIAWPLYTTQLSTTTLLLRRLDNDKQSTRFINGPLRRWL